MLCSIRIISNVQENANVPFYYAASIFIPRTDYIVNLALQFLPASYAFVCKTAELERFNAITADYVANLINIL